MNTQFWLSWLCGVFTAYCFSQEHSVIRATEVAKANSETEETNKQARKFLIDEISVVGSHLRGVEPISPIITYNHEHLVETGIPSVHQFIQSLPQNFSGGDSENSTGGFSLTRSNLNLTHGTGVNFRGLGTDSTLVLWNGHRLSASGLGRYSDVSFMPMSFLEKIEVMWDGASTIYGSDAIGGVVNLVPKRNFHGLETRVLYGSTTDGSQQTRRLGQAFGNTWENGNVLINCDYDNRDPIFAHDRDYAKNSAGPHTLLAEQERGSLFLSASQFINDKIRLFVDALYSNRNFEFRYAPFMFARRARGNTDMLHLALGSNIALPEGWGLTTVLMKSKETEDLTDIFLNPEEVVWPTTFIEAESQIKSFEIKADGEIFKTPGGKVHLAVGTHIRWEDFIDLERRKRAAASIIDRRKTSAVFTETSIPIIGPYTERALAKSLKLNIAFRYEDYTDFGSTSNAKFGIQWSPVNDLTLRFTNGTSFRAPLPFESSKLYKSSQFIPLVDPLSDTGTTITLVASSSNQDLEPEEARTKTYSIEYMPLAIPDLFVRATYFDLEFRNRITRFNLIFDALFDPEYAPLVTRNPSRELLERFSKVPRVTSLVPGMAPDEIDLDTVGAFIDNRYNNSALVDMRGIDLLVSYSIPVDSSIWDITFNASYLLELSEQLLSTFPASDLRNRPQHPVDFKARLGIGWSKNNWNTGTFVNYTDSYNDNRTIPHTQVESWTTLDSTITYDTSDSAKGLLEGIEVTLSVLNMLNEEPPFVKDKFFNFNYDPDNASAVGRFVSLSLTKKW